MNDQNNTNAKVIGLSMAGIAAVALIYLFSMPDKKVETKEKKK